MADDLKVLMAEMAVAKMPGGKVASICRHIAELHRTSEFFNRTWNKFWAGDRLQIWCCDDCFPVIKEGFLQKGIAVRDVTIRN